MWRIQYASFVDVVRYESSRMGAQALRGVRETGMVTLGKLGRLILNGGRKE